MEMKPINDHAKLLGYAVGQLFGVLSLIKLLSHMPVAGLSRQLQHHSLVIFVSKCLVPKCLDSNPKCPLPTGIGGRADHIGPWERVIGNCKTTRLVYLQMRWLIEATLNNLLIYIHPLWLTVPYTDLTWSLVFTITRPIYAGHSIECTTHVWPLDRLLHFWPCALTFDLWTRPIIHWSAT